MTAPTIIIHSLDHARAALAAARDVGRCVILESPAEGAASMGAGVFREMVTAAREAVPEAESLVVLDCGVDPGRALNALRLGVEGIRLGASEDVLARVGDIAAQCGAVLFSGERGEALDLLNCDDLDAACHDWLSAAGKDRVPPS